MTRSAPPSAPDWGVGHYERTAELLLPAAQALVELAEVRPGDRVLDVGTGTGNVALLAAAAGATVTAVDPSERLLGVARTAARERHLDLTCLIGEAAALPVSDASTDCLLSNFGVVFAEDAAAAAAEMARVLAPAGRILFSAWLPGGAVGALAAATQELVRGVQGTPPAPRGFPWHDGAAVAGLLSGHGLTVAVEDTREIVFTAPSTQAYLDVEVANHPLAIAAFAVLQRRGQLEAARERLLAVLAQHNEDPDGFRSTSRYAVLSAHRG